MIEERNTITNGSTEFGLPTNDEQIKSFSIQNNIENRNTRNSFFKVEIENTETQFNFDAVPEIGAVVYADKHAFIGNGQEWKQLANTEDIPVIPPTINVGFQVAIDTHYTSQANGKTIGILEELIPNDAGTEYGNIRVYSGSKFYFERNLMYTVSISFSASVNANNQHAELFFGTSGITWNGYKDILFFPKGNGVAHTFTRTYQILGDAFSQDNGVNVYIFPSKDGKIWGAQFSIQSISQQVV